MLSAKLTNQERKAIYRREGYRCALCDSTRYLQIHHVISRGSGGTNHPHNLICLCSDCHALAHGINLNDWDATQEDVEQAIVGVSVRPVRGGSMESVPQSSGQAGGGSAASSRCAAVGPVALRRARCVGGYQAWHVPVLGPAPTSGAKPLGGHPSRLFFRRKAAPEQRGMRACSKTPGHHPAPLRPMAGGPGAVRGAPSRRVGRPHNARPLRRAWAPVCVGAAPAPGGRSACRLFCPPVARGGRGPPGGPACGGAVPGVRRASLAAPLRSPRAGIVAAGLRRSAGFRWSPLPRSARPPRPCRPAPGPPTPAAGRPLNAPSGAARGRSRRFALAPPSGGRLGAGRKRPALDAAAAPRTKGKGLTY